jgi:hypothetical protein
MPSGLNRRLLANNLGKRRFFAWATVHGYATLAGGYDPMRPKAEPEIFNDLLERIWFGIVKGVGEIKK